MAITNKGGFDDLNADEQEPSQGTRRKIGFGHPATPHEFIAEEPGQADLLKGRDTPTSRKDLTTQGD